MAKPLGAVFATNPEGYVCPQTQEPLVADAAGLRRADGVLYPWVFSDGLRIADFVAGHARLQSDKETQAMYNSPHASDIYRNFLDWLFASFAVREEEFRALLVERLCLQPGQRVLVTGCGLGEDLPLIAREIGGDGAIYAQDLAKRMVVHARERYPAQLPVPFWSIGDAMELPFPDGFFDSVFHFGGINLFGDMPRAIGEMARVTRAGGRVVFGDEGVAPWLRGTEYARVAITNIPLWESRTPLESLPAGVDDVHCTWVLGQCFYLIDFAVAPDGPRMDIDVPHKGRRGGTARTRAYGQLEGVTPDARRQAAEAAAREGVSLHEWLDRAVRAAAADGGRQ
jgi:ubiquinone/menaquinone biosynthesis C-methylase UbiE